MEDTQIVNNETELDATARALTAMFMLLDESEDRVKQRLEQGVCDD
jgi:hypothetical protein